MVEAASDKQFIPNDVAFASDGLRAMVITGCNMSGKSSYSRMAALLVIMAQIGCYLPCQSATIGIVDYVGTRFGASDEISRGRSVSLTPERCSLRELSSPADFHGGTHRNLRDHQGRFFTLSDRA